MAGKDDRFADERAPLVASGGQTASDAGPQLAVHGESVFDDGQLGKRLSESKSGWYLFLLTLSIGGLQIVWSVELSYGSPYLLSLGMSKSLLAFVWIAGPLTGTLVQPYIGMRSDDCRISWGKRKPFMVAGGIATVVTLLALAWVQELVGSFVSVFGIDRYSSGVKTTIIVMATILMYCVDIAINTVQAGIRCFIVDNAPPHQQEAANAWASRLTGVGNILGYVFGYMDLPKYFPFLGISQFQVFCALASIALLITLLVSCLYIRERDPRNDGPPDSRGTGIVTFFKHVLKSVRHLPPEIAKVCEVQVAAWIGWFPFLFYATTYIGQLYLNPILEDHRDLSDEEINKLWEEATRIGTFGLLIYAVISFIASIALPVLVVPTYQKAVLCDSSDRDGHEEESDVRQTPQLSSVSFGQRLINSVGKARETGKGPSLLSKLQIPGLTLRRTWFLSHLLFAVCTFSTFFIRTYQAGTAAIALVGICWALTLWAPFALISAEVSRIDAEHRARRQYTRAAEITQRRHNMSHDSINEDLEDRPDSRTAGDVDKEENLAQAGVVLGLHNVAVSAPQILSSLICSGIFKLAQKPRGEPWDDSVGWVLRFGGCAALIAGWLTTRLEKEKRVVPI